MRNPTLQDARKDSETDGDREEAFTLRRPTLQDPQDARSDSETDGDRKVRTLRNPTLQDAQRDRWGPGGGLHTEESNPPGCPTLQDSETDGDQKVRTPAQVMFFESQG